MKAGTCLALVVALTMTTAASSAQESARAGDMVIERPWARASIVANRPAAAYLTVRNQGTASDTIVSVRSPVAGRAEIHAITNDGGVMKMAPAGPIEIPAGSEQSLAPGGLHIMMTKLKAPLVKGETLEMTIVFEKAGDVTVQVPVLGAGATGPE